MNWTLGGVRIFVQEYNLEGGQIIPRLQPIAGGTILQIFGYESVTKSLSALIVGAADMIALVAMTQDGAGHVLDSPYGTVGTYYVQKVGVKQVQCLCQTLRPELGDDSPVYSLTLTLYGV